MSEVSEPVLEISARRSSLWRQVVRYRKPPARAELACTRVTVTGRHGSTEDVMTAIGIDVAKQTLAIDAVLPDGKRRQKHCANSATGHADLIRWIGRQ